MKNITSSGKLGLVLVWQRKQAYQFRYVKCFWNSRLFAQAWTCLKNFMFGYGTIELGGRPMITKIIFCFLLVSSSVYAIPASISIAGQIELGSDAYSYTTFETIDLGLKINFWKCKNYLYIGQTSWMEMDWNKFSAYPFRIIYYYGNRFSIAGFFIDVRHFCNHPVKSGPLHQWNYIENGTTRVFVPTQKWWNNYWGETITTISIGYEFEFELWHN